MHLHKKILTKYSVLQSLHKVLPSTTSYYKACTQYFPVLLRTTKHAQSTSQYYFVLQSLHRVRPSTTLYYKACTSTSKCYFLLQSLRKILPSTTSHYRTCTRYFPVLLRTTKLAFAFFPKCLTSELHFARKGCISCRLVGTAPRLKREIAKKERAEGKRARGQEGKRARGQEGKRAREQEGKRAREQESRGPEGKKARGQESKRARGQEGKREKMRRCEDEKVWRWEDVKMRRCEDGKMWWQTSTIRRTLCSDALGKNTPKTQCFGDFWSIYWWDLGGRV